MEFYEAVEKRCVVREWEKRDVPFDAVKRILAAGLKAPTHDHQRNWEFVVLHGEEEKERALQFVKPWSVTQEENAAINAMDSVPRRMYAYAMPRQHTMLADAPYVVIPLFKAAPGLFRSTSVNGLNSFASIWCVVENIFLAAAAEGLACSMRIPVREEGPKLLSALGVPESYMAPCYIGIGYAAENAEAVEQIEPKVEDRLHFGKW